MVKKYRPSEKQISIDIELHNVIKEYATQDRRTIKETIKILIEDGIRHREETRND